MSDTSLILSLPLLQPAQAQKHVTHNEALRRLDALVQLVVTDRTRFEAPALPEPGDRHIIAADPIGLWAGRPGQIALWEATGWDFIAPLPGWQAFVRAEGRNVVWTGTAWVVLTHLTPQVDTLGINTVADSTNRLVVAAPATLLTHQGAGHQVKVNKATPADTASLLFQTGWSGRAEMGLAGDDGFAIRVSADGAAFATALQADPASAAVSLPGGLLAPAGTLAAPGIRFAADPDTGLRRPAADQIGLVTGGVQRALLGNAALQLDVPLTGTAVTQSAIDSTAGRVQRNGDFGVGGLLPRLANIGVTDNSIVSGLYAYDTSLGSSGGPAHVARGSLIHTRRNVGGGETQSLVVESSGNAAVVAGMTFSRSRVSGAWTAWLVGGILEVGSNANGRYVKQADGTLTCTHVITTSASAEGVWTFPAAFGTLVDLRIALGVNASALLNLAPRFTNRTMTAVDVSCFNTANARIATAVEAIAIGRWF